MIVGVPTEIKPDERRVALTPAGAAAFRSHSHRVLVQSGAGVGSGFSDAEYRAAGAQHPAIGRRGVEARRDDAQGQGAAARRNSAFCASGLILFTYLHLAAEPALARELCVAARAVLGYETVAARRTRACRCSRR